MAGNRTLACNRQPAMSVPWQVIDFGPANASLTLAGKMPARAGKMPALPRNAHQQFPPKGGGRFPNLKRVKKLALPAAIGMAGVEKVGGDFLMLDPGIFGVGQIHLGLRQGEYRNKR
jgi:hypothetical protein